VPNSQVVVGAASVVKLEGMFSSSCTRCCVVGGVAKSSSELGVFWICSTSGLWCVLDSGEIFATGEHNLTCVSFRVRNSVKVGSKSGSSRSCWVVVFWFSSCNSLVVVLLAKCSW